MNIDRHRFQIPRHTHQSISGKQTIVHVQRTADLLVKCPLVSRNNGRRLADDNGISDNGVTVAVNDLCLT